MSLAQAEAAGRGAEGRPQRRLRLPYLATTVAISLQTLVAGGPAIGSNVPVAETAPCPLGHYRRADLVFACGRQDGEVYFPLANVSKTAMDIPKGIRNLKLTLDASGPVDVTLVDRATGAMVANGTAKLEAKVAWQDVTIAFASAQSPSGGTREGLEFFGTLPSTLRVKMANKLTSQNVVAITYSYGDFEGCPQVPVGCARYDQAAAREAVFNWSSWVSTQYPKAALAWQALTAKAMETQYGSSTRAGPIPFHLWYGVWSKWPGAAKAEAKNVTWQAAFKFIDSLHTEDQQVEVVEFIRAYKIAGIGLSMYNWCMALRTQYPDAAKAWLGVVGPTSIAGVDYSRWKSTVWPSFVPLDHFAKASSAGSFQYVDASQNGVISKEEFEEIYNACDYTPSSYPTTTAAASASLRDSSTSAAPTGATTTSASTSGTNASAESQELSEELGSAAPTAAARGSGNATAGAARNASECCREAVARCLACEAGESLMDFCGGSLGATTVGCDVTSKLIDDHEEVQELRQRLRGHPGHLRYLHENAGKAESAVEAESDCPYPGISYAPAMPKHNTTESTVKDCQVKCVNTPGCAYFSYRSDRGSCNLHGPNAVWSLTLDPHLLSGPVRCIAKLRMRITDVDFKALSDDQKRNTAWHMLQDVAAATKVDQNSIKDLAGNHGSVSLSAGSLVVSATMELPPGARKSNCSRALRSEAFAKQLRSSLEQVGARSPKVADHPVQPLDAVEISLEDTEGCSLRSTRYDDPKEKKDDALLPASTADSAGCQALCQEVGDCNYFSFILSTNECLLRGKGAVAVYDENAVSGPRQCSGLPVVPKGGWINFVGSALKAGPVHFYLWWLLLGASVAAVSLGGLALYFLTKRTKRKRGGKVGDYAPLSRQDEDTNGHMVACGQSDSEEDDHNQALIIDRHPFTMEPASRRDEHSGMFLGVNDIQSPRSANGDQERNFSGIVKDQGAKLRASVGAGGEKLRGVISAVGRNMPSLRTSSREAGGNIMGFLGPEALRH